jgi:hypothetical protein
MVSLHVLVAADPSEWSSVANDNQGGLIRNEAPSMPFDDFGMFIHNAHPKVGNVRNQGPEMLNSQ